MGGQKVWKKNGIDSYFPPLACDSRIFYPRNDSMKKIEILFTSRRLKDRIEGYRKYLYPLIEHFGRRVAIVGDNWKDDEHAVKAFVLPSVPYYLIE